MYTIPQTRHSVRTQWDAVTELQCRGQKKADTRKGIKTFATALTCSSTCSLCQKKADTRKGIKTPLQNPRLSQRHLIYISQKKADTRKGIKTESADALPFGRPMLRQKKADTRKGIKTINAAAAGTDVVFWVRRKPILARVLRPQEPDVAA